MNLVDLETFVRVAETGSITKASLALGVPKSTVSRRVARLEDSVGVGLLRRSGRSVVLTDEGSSLHRRCAHALGEIIEAGKTLSDSSGEVRGHLRLSAPHDLGASDAFAQLVMDFRARFPRVSFELELTTRMVDLVEEAFDAALRVHLAPLPDSSALRVKRIEKLSSQIYASPGYLERYGEPEVPADLSKHACVALSRGRADVRWPLRSKEREVVAGGEAAVLVSDFTTALSMVLAGVGVGVLPSFIAAPHVRRGRVVPLLPAWELEEGTLSLVWPVSRHMAPKLRAFIDFLKERSHGGSLFGKPATP